MLANKFAARCFFCWLLLVSFYTTNAQVKTTELLKTLKIAQSKSNYLTDTANVSLLNRLAYQYRYENADSSLLYAKKALSLAQSQNSTLGEARSWHSIGRAYYVIGDYDLSLDAASRLMAFSNKINDTAGIAGAYQIMGLIYMAQDKYSDAIADLNKALDMFISIGNKGQIGNTYLNIAICYDESGKPAKAFYFVNKALSQANAEKDAGLLSMVQNRAGEIYFHSKNYKKALAYYQKVAGGKQVSKWEQDFAWSGIAQCYYALGKYTKAIIAAQKGLSLSKQVNSASDALRAMQVLMRKLWRD